jgi:transcriptional regulator with XRE-family HTH domain
MLDLETLPPGRRIRVRRVMLGLGQADLAARLKTAASLVSEAERDGWVRPAVDRFRERLDAELSVLERDAAAVRQREGVPA